MRPGPYRRVPARRLATALLVAAPVFVGACGETLERLPRPNVLLIVIDCLRADHVSESSEEILVRSSTHAWSWTERTAR